MSGARTVLSATGPSTQPRRFSRMQSRSARQAICVPAFTCRRIRPLHPDPHPSGHSDQPGESIRQGRPARPFLAATGPLARPLVTEVTISRLQRRPPRPLHRPPRRRLSRRPADDGVRLPGHAEGRSPMTVTVLRKLEVPALPVQPTATRSPAILSRCERPGGVPSHSRHSKHIPRRRHTFEDVNPAIAKFDP